MAMATATTTVSVTTAVRRFALVLFAMMAMNEEGEDAGKEEKDAVHDPEGEAGLEHGAGLVDVDGIFAAPASTPGSKDSKVDVETAGLEVGASRPGHAAKDGDAGDESRQEAEIDERDENGRVLSSCISKDRGDGPHHGQDRGDEDDQDKVRRQNIGRRVTPYKVRKHANGGDQSGTHESANAIPPDRTKPQRRTNVMNCIHRQKANARPMIIFPP